MHCTTRRFWECYDALPEAVQRTAESGNLMHYTTRRFWECYDALPEAVQRTADQCYELLKAAPTHPSLHFKKVGKYWSVRAGQGYRALGVEVEEGILWFWVGTHAEYDRLIAKQ